MTQPEPGGHGAPERRQKLVAALVLVLATLAFVWIVIVPLLPAG